MLIKKEISNNEPNPLLCYRFQVRLFTCLNIQQFNNDYTVHVLHNIGVNFKLWFLKPLDISNFF